MTLFGAFVTGVFVGTTIGVVIMAILFSAKQADLQMEKAASAKATDSES